MFSNTDAEKEIRNAFNTLWKKVPRKIRLKFVSHLVIPFVLISIFSVALTPILAAFNQFLKITNNVKSEKSKEDAGNGVNNFRGDDLKKWVGVENLVCREGGIFQPNLTGNFSEGREIFFDHKVNSHFQALLTFIPLDENEISIAVNYGHRWRVVIGNGDYNQIRLQKNERFPEENLGEGDWKNVSEKNGNKWIKPNRGLEPRKEIKVIIKSRPKTNTNKVVVDVLITGFLKGNNKAEDFEKFSYEIETNQIDFLKEMIGIGLLDSHKKGIKTKLEEFELHEF